LIAWLKARPEVQFAGRIGAYFHIDPLSVLKGNSFDLALRAAAFGYMQEVEAAKERAKAEAHAKAQAQTQRRR